MTSDQIKKQLQNARELTRLILQNILDMSELMEDEQLYNLLDSMCTDVDDCMEDHIHKITQTNNK